MNERIRELAEQAGRWCYDNYDIPTQELFQEKFAESIVRECIGVVDDAERGGGNEIWDNAVKFIRQDLKEHFGIKE